MANKSSNKTTAHLKLSCLLFFASICACSAGYLQQPVNQQPPRDTLQAQLAAVQAQARAQFQQLNGLVLNGANQVAANLTANRVGNVLEALSNVGKAIQNQIMSQPGGQFQIMTGANQKQTGLGISELANTKKNEYQPIVVNDNQIFNPTTSGSSLTSGNNNTTTIINYREQGEILRQEILKRAGQLQQVVASSMDLLKNNGDLIVRRLLEQLNVRLDQAKAKADKIINEPTNNEVAYKALTTINQGLNNLNNIITNIVNRLDLSAKEAPNQQQQQVDNLNQMQRTSGQETNLLLSSEKFRRNFQQIGQQFSSALNAVKQKQLEQQQLEQQQQKQRVQIN